MKFLCDRCKTRYSIGDDRVRGKILKIRCKNCANVITVREGMTDADAADPAPRANSTTAASTVVGAPLAANGAGALGAAFATALTTKPPAALEEEWYVSIDGDQSGPFSLADAQSWVASKAFDADLHCWSEGFDDWLPVDKVSHFRGLRKKPIAPPLPPPMPRAPGLGATPAHRLVGQSTPQGHKIEEEPKPLFAATMASLERSAPAASNPGLVLPALNGNGTARATPPGGATAMPSITKPANGALKVPNAIAPLTAKGTQSEPVRNGGAAAVRNAFDVGDQATMIEAPPFDDEAQTAAEPAARKKREDVIAAAAASAFPPIENKIADAPATSGSVLDEPDDDELQIGEVSRVVNLADLLASKPKRATTVGGGNAAPRGSGPIAPASLNRTGAVPRLGNTAAVPRISNTAAVPRIDDPSLAGQPGDPMAAEAPSDLAMAPAVQANHRRGLIILIAAAVLLLAGVIIAVVMFVGGDSDITTLGRSDSIDTTRPDELLRPRPGTPENPQVGSAQNPFFPQPKVRPKIPTTNQNPTIDVDPPGGQRLGGEDVEAMARSQSPTTQRCYMRAQRGADAILIGDVKKISVTLEISPDGTVKSVGLSSNSENTLGKCLISAIRGWKFRASPGGTYKFALVFSAS